ncbi:Protein CBG03620 [Caenorhabditis briggsae]|uniref:Uncharacterized protein n=3 Tax=Caenorhabditis briggsae TaxID=6238 RepID=A0AAE9DFD4_CAEBR|nr:Protein CBG03620 [Caenorhabditis briggsae]ULU02582.1 hypothetical protein L3Y34_002279 [Caenorhabditis briggsae]CAP24481.1 Protein CBG03620 [Caenorhabditis briggsae]
MCTTVFYSDNGNLKKILFRIAKEYAYDMDFYHFHQARRTMWSFASSFHEATQEERIYHLQEANEQLQKILEPAPVEDYDAIPYEELLERYNFIQTRRDKVNKLFGDRRRRPYTFKE